MLSGRVRGEGMEGMARGLWSWVLSSTLLPLLLFAKAYMQQERREWGIIGNGFGSDLGMN